MRCIEVVKVFVFTECYELSTVRNDTPIYKEHSDKQRSRVYFVYIQVNVKFVHTFLPGLILVIQKWGLQILLMCT